MMFDWVDTLVEPLDQKGFITQSSTTLVYLFVFFGEFIIMASSKCSLSLSLLRVVQTLDKHQNARAIHSYWPYACSSCLTSASRSATGRKADLAALMFWNRVSQTTNWGLTPNLPYPLNRKLISPSHQSQYDSQSTRSWSLYQDHPSTPNSLAPLSGICKIFDEKNV